MKKILKKLSLITIAFCLISIGLSIFTAKRAAFPWWYKPELVGIRFSECTNHQKKVNLYCENPLTDLHLNFKNFETTEVSGWVIEQLSHSKGTIILVHGAGNDRRALMKHATYLRLAGYDVILIDCFNHGLSQTDGKGISYGFKESNSIIAAMNWAKKNNLQAPFVAMGTSQGAFSSLLAAAKNPSIEAVIAENPFYSGQRILLEYPAMKWVPKFIKILAFKFLNIQIGTNIDDLDASKFLTKDFKTPVFLIHGTEDETISQKHSEDIFEILKNIQGSNTISKLWIVPNAKHQTEWNLDHKTYEKNVIEFLNKALDHAARLNEE